MDAEGVVDLVTGVVTTWGLRVVGAIGVLVIGRVIAGLIRRAVRKALNKANVEPTLIPFLAGLVYNLTLAFVLISVLRLFGLETTSLVAVLGAAGLAVGLALQGTLSNFASGVMLLLFRPFKVGDFVETGGVTGKVVELGLFTTTLASPGNVRVTVPNSKVWGETISNFNGFPTRRVDLVVGVSYDDDLSVVTETIRKVLAADSRVLSEPEPQVEVSEMGASSVDLVVRPWCTSEDYWNLKFALTRQLKEKLEEAGCSIPYPQRDVHVHQVD
ncbi:MAG: mechanosensitive ion channel [Thermoanaerobaculia bacterium]|nr:mechanosensitive ion channel [Thermoanaerobaculia bacterium]